MLLAGMTFALIAVGVAFITLGTVGMIRMPDVHCRLHALTKADNLGLGFIVLGLMLQAESLVAIAKLAVIWTLVLLASTTACYLIAHEGVRGVRH